MSIAAVSTAGATPDVMLPTAAMIISCRPFEKRRVAPCIPAILQLPLKCEGRGVRYGATDTPLWLEAAAVWLEGRSGRLAGGKSSPAAKERAQRRTRPQRDSGQQYTPRWLSSWCMAPLVDADIRSGGRPGPMATAPTPKLLLSASRPIPNRQAPALDLTSPLRPTPPRYRHSRQQQSPPWHEEYCMRCI